MASKPSSEALPPVEISTVAATTINRQRISLTIDPLGQQGSTLAATLLPLRVEAVAKIFLGMQQVKSNLLNITQALALPLVPATLVGVLQQPDGTNAALVQLQLNPADLGASGPPVAVTTGDAGDFVLRVPPGVPLPPAGIPLVAHGANANAQVTIPASRVAANGLVGAVQLPQALSPLPVSILKALQGLAPPPAVGTPPAPPANPPQLAAVKLGEAGGCQLSYGANTMVDSFPYGVFFRLVEPRLSIVQQVLRQQINEETFFPLPIYATQAGQVPAGAATAYVDRVPVEQPLSADGFRDQLMGLDAAGIITADETIPMAATLGLGYVLWMSQQWTFQGVGLGDLVYSLPLAPGEQQQMAVFERLDTAAVSESETFSEQQAEQQSALADTSTAATFDSAFSEMASGGSAFQSNASTSSWGASILIASGGGGSSSAAGSSSSWLQGQRDSTQQAAESTHSAAENQASARRSAARTGMRLATASESESVTTRVITNHNHAHALTLQYWEVQRLYNLTTAIDGVTLTCLVPMQIVRFLPPGQPLAITNPATLATAAQVLGRYGALVKHADVLAVALPRRFQYGLTLLQQFASDPTATVEPFGGPAEDVINFSLHGSFVACEDIYVVAVTRRNTRVGPVKLNGPTDGIPLDTYASKDDLMAALGRFRQTSSHGLAGSLALPQTMNRGDIIGFEISRGFRQVDYTLVSAEAAALMALQTLLGANASLFATSIQSTLAASNASSARQTIHVTPNELENALGGPLLFQFSAAIQEWSGAGAPPSAPPPTQRETYANDSLNGTILPQQPLPVPAIQLGAVLRFNEIVEIEKMAQHVVRNTTLYSKAVWASLSADERAILLDQYTIGVPPGGVTDESQMVPLLNCVQNKPLGFFGNSMILPFIIPQSVAEQMEIDPAQIQQALLAYQRSAFTPPQSTVALPTRGVLGEAVLGRCPSAEKIDLTRFWNWQDSPSDAAPAISPVTLPTTTPSIAAGLTAPNSLTNLPSLINNVLTAPAPDTSLLQALGKAAASQADFSPTLTGAAQLAGLLTNAQNVSNSARADALKTTKDLQSQAMATVGNIVGGIFAGNPTAGSSAASAVNGSGGGAAGATGAAAKPAQAGGTKAGQPSTGTPGGAPGSGSGTPGAGSPATGGGTTPTDPGTGGGGVTV